jgi:type VI protein secretion system component VasF
MIVPSEPTPYDESRLAALLRELAEPPRDWIEAAAELPRVRASLDSIVERAEADAEARAEILSGLEQALRDAGHEPEPRLLAVLRARLEPADGER